MEVDVIAILVVNASRLREPLRIPTIARMYSDLMPRSVPI